MLLSSNHHDLFHQSDTADKISLFQNLLQSHDLSADEALALLRSIHTELEQPQGHDRSIYENYARMMESLRHEMPEVHQYVVENWRSPRQAASIQEFVEDEVGDEHEPESERGETSKHEAAAESENKEGGEVEEAEESEEHEEPEEEAE